MSGRIIDSFVNAAISGNLPIRFKATVGAGGQVNILDCYIANKVGGTSIKCLPEDVQLEIIDQINARARESDAEMIDFDVRR